MPIERLRLLSILTIGAGLTAFLSGDFSRIQIVIFMAVIAPLWFPIDIEKIRQNRFWKFYLWITFAFMIFGFVLKIRIDTGIFFLIIFCLIYEFYGEQRKNTPNRLISILSFLIIAYQARMYLGLKQIYIVLIYLVSVMTTLMGLYHFILNKGLNKGELLRSHLRVYVHLVPIFAIAACLFWLTPRARGSSAGVESNPRGNQMSGFSDRVKLSDIGALKLSSKPVLDLTLLEGQPEEPYLIGRYLHIFKDAEWSTYARPKTIFGQQARFHEAGEFRGTVTYRINAEPFQGNTLFFFRDPIAILDFEQFLDVEGFYDNISMSKKSPNSLNYNAVSGIAQREQRSLGRYTGHLLQLPDNSEYLADYARTIWGEGNQDAHEKAAIVRRHFQEQFNYTLNINNFNAQDPIRDFLLNRKEGHCELFASSAALLMRQAGIPTRMVTGFMLDLTLKHESFIHVQERMAHAWVEYFHDGAWHTLDATPPMPIAEPTLFQSGSNRLRYWWRVYFTSFDYFSQKEWLEKIQESYAVNQALYRNIFLTAIFMITFAILYHKNRELLHMTSEDKVRQTLVRIEKNLAKHYQDRIPHEKFSDFVRRLGLNPSMEIKIEAFSHEVFSYCYGRQKTKENTRHLIKKGRAILKELQQQQS